MYIYLFENSAVCAGLELVPLCGRQFADLVPGIERRGWLALVSVRRCQIKHTINSSWVFAQCSEPHAKTIFSFNKIFIISFCDFRDYLTRSVDEKNILLYFDYNFF